jgi:AAT family amino acid transporter
MLDPDFLYRVFFLFDMISISGAPHITMDQDKQPAVAAPASETEYFHQVAVQHDRLKRGLSARQVQMIAIGGTIGTGLFLGTGKALATGGPASMLIAYAISGGIVFLTMLSLGEMAAFIPVAGSFCTFAG